VFGAAVTKIDFGWKWFMFGCVY